jgi:hypothetical protein
MLPVRQWRPWIVKVAVAMALGVGLGAALPSALLTAVGYGGQLPPLVSQVTLVVLATAVGMYASSLSTSGVRALTVAFPAALLALVFVWKVDSVIFPYIVQRQMLPLNPGVVVPVLVVTLLWFAYLNHRSIERSPRRVAPQLASVLLILAAATVLS